MPPRLRKIWRDWLRPIGVTVILLASFRSAIADWNDVPTGSMKPTIAEGDRILVNKLAYDLKVPFTTRRVATWSAPARGDIVVFFSPVDGTRLVKRVVGVPGDTLELRDNRLFIDGEAATYEPLGGEAEGAEALGAADGYREDLGGAHHAILVTPGLASRRSFEALTVPPGQVFVMGDNRDNSYDSRWWGCLDERLIVGRASAVVVSVDPARHYAPRWGRFFRGLE